MITKEVKIISSGSIKKVEEEYKKFVSNQMITVTSTQFSTSGIGDFSKYSIAIFYNDFTSIIKVIMKK